MASINFSGLNSGIDTDKVIQGLLEAQKNQVTLAENRRQAVVARQAALSALRGQISKLRSASGDLVRSQGGVVGRREVRLSNDTFVAATASNRAAEGIYQVRVNQLAQAHQVATQAFSSPDAAITQGTLELRVGQRPPVTITVDSTNDTLTGLAESINRAAPGASATLLTDSSGTRLLLTSRETGTTNAITLTNNLAAGDKPEFNLTTPVQEAADASVSVGSGAGAITVTSSTNRFDSLIEGVRIDLLKSDPGTPLTIEVARDPSAAIKAVSDFVEAFNGAMEFIDTQSKVGIDGAASGLLQGNRTARQLQQEIRSTVLGVIPGANSRMNRLSALGISVSDQGRLEVDTARVTSALQGDVEGVTEADIRRLFALDGQSSNPGFSFILGSAKTQASTTPYDVEITQAATRAELTAGTSLAASTVIDGTNDSLSLTINGQSTGNLALTHGNYTRSQLATLLRSTIQAAPQSTGTDVRVTLSGDQLQLTTGTFGRDARIELGSGSAWSTLGWAGTESSKGTDVAGYFLVAGQRENAVGRGQILTSSATNAQTADLQLRVTLGPGDLGPDSESQITVTRGVAARLEQVLADAVAPEGGTLQSADDSLTEELKRIQSQLDRQNAVVETQRTRLLRQFQAMETALGQLQSVSGLLGQQLSSNSNNSNG
jgi:flagellar hook-associated protein 2